MLYLRVKIGISIISKIRFFVLNLGCFPSSNKKVGKHLPTKGAILIDNAILDPDLSVSGEGTLATLSFTCLKAGYTSIEFSLAKTRDTNNKEIITTKRNARVKSK